jgi:hypothetical protein
MNKDHDTTVSFFAAVFLFCLFCTVGSFWFNKLLTVGASPAVVLSKKTVALWNFRLQNCNRLQKKKKTKQIIKHPLKI